MLNYENIKNDLKEIWRDPLHKELITKKLDVSTYETLNGVIPDKYLNIDEVFPEDEIDEIWNNFKPYLQEHNIFPFIRTLDESVICMGYGDNNNGKIFYFNFDFGCIPLEESLDKFLSGLIDK